MLASIRCRHVDLNGVECAHIVCASPSVRPELLGRSLLLEDEILHFLVVLVVGGQSDFRHLSDDLFILQRFGDALVPLGDDLRRQVGRTGYAKPVHHRSLGIARLARGRNVRKLGETLRPGHGEHAHTAGLVRAGKPRPRRYADLHMTAGGQRHGFRAALELDRPRSRGVDAEGVDPAPEHEVLRSGAAQRGPGDRAGVLLDRLGCILHCPERRLVRHDEDVRRLHHDGNERAVHHLPRQLLDHDFEQRALRLAVHQHGVAVGLGAHHLIHRGHGIAARLVDDAYRDAPFSFQCTGEDTRGEIGRPARSETHHHVDGLGGIGLRLGLRGQHRSGERKHSKFHKSCHCRVLPPALNPSSLVDGVVHQGRHFA